MCNCMLFFPQYDTCENYQCWLVCQLFMASFIFLIFFIYLSLQSYVPLVILKHLKLSLSRTFNNIIICDRCFDRHIFLFFLMLHYFYSGNDVIDGTLKMTRITIFFSKQC